MIGPSSRISPLGRAALLVGHPREPRREPAGDVEEVELLDVVGEAPDLVGQLGEHVVADRRAPRRPAGGTAPGEGPASRSPRRPWPIAERGAPSSSASAPKNSLGRSVARIASTPVSDGLEILTRPREHDVQRVAGIALVEDHLAPPVAPRADARGERRRGRRRRGRRNSGIRAERGRSAAGSGRLSRLAHRRIDVRPAAIGGRGVQEIDRTGACACRRADAHPRRDRPGDGLERDGGRPRLALGDRRHAGVAALADRDVERDLAQEVDAVLLREPLAAAPAEDLGRLAAVRADERAHVLDDADDRARSAAGASRAPCATSDRATSWGVVTSTVPLIGTAWASVSCASDVPGGRSTTR